LGSEALAYTEQGWIVRLTGSKAQRLPETPVPLRGLWGRWPDRLFAAYPRGDAYLPNTLAQLDGPTGAWVDAFDGDDFIQNSVLWGHGAVVHVHAPADNMQWVGLQASEPPPSIRPLPEVCPQPEDLWFTNITVDRHGNLAAAWACTIDMHFAVWRPGLPEPTTRQFPTPFDQEMPFVLAPDEQGGFYAAMRSGHVVHFDREGTQIIEPPRGLGFSRNLDVDPDGRLWMRHGDRLYVRGAAKWAREWTRGTGMVREFEGVEHGVAWMRRGGSYELDGPELRDNGKILARDRDGRWHRVADPPAVFRSGVLHPDFLQVDDDGYAWILAHASGDSDYRAVATNRPGGEPVDCSGR
jgi:hypothetical protein